MSDEQKEEQKLPTPTDVLVKAMEEFGNSEPLDVIVIFTAEDDSINWLSNIASRFRRMGILEQVKQIIAAGEVQD